MKGNGKRILSLFLAAVIAVTTVGYAPPFTSLASWKTNMEKALELLASPSESTKQGSTATPSEAESLGREATPSEAEIPDGKATPSEVVKKFVRVEPEEIPEYYSQASDLGKKFWKFEDRYGMMQYRDYGYLQGDVEFPLWYVTDLTGTVDDASDSVNLDEEYYDLAPFVYRSVVPDETAWTSLSWRLFSNNNEINDYIRKKISGFKNWDTSGYYIWHLESDDNGNLGYHFYGIIINEEEREGQPGWYYSDEDGVINVNNMLRASLMATTYYDYEWYLDAPGQFRSSIPSNQYLIKDHPSMGGSTMYPQKPYQSAIDRGMNFTSKFVAWASYRSNDNSFSVPRYNASNVVIGYDLLNGDPANIDSYYSSVTLLSQGFIFKSDEWYPTSIYGVWCPDNADMYIFAREQEDRVNKKVEYFNVGNYTYDIQDIKVRRNSSFNIDSVSKPSKSGYIFEGWRLGSGYGDYIASGTEINCGTSGKVTWVFPSFKPLENTVIFQDIDGNILSEQIVLSGNSATAPTPPVIPGKIFTGWGGDYSNISKDSTFKAQYKDTVTLTLMGNGGLIDGSETYTKELIYGTRTYDLLKNLESKTTRSLYNFKGWYTNPEGSGSSYYPSGLGSDLTLYAVWERNSNYIIYYRNLDGSDTNYQRVGKINEGDAIGNPPNFSSSNGKRIVKWHLEKFGYAFEYGSGVQPDYKMPGESLNLYGKWDNWTVNYTINYGIGDSRPPRTMTLNSSNSDKVLCERYLPSTASMEVPGYISTGYGNGWCDDNGVILPTDLKYATTTNRNVYFARTPKTLKFIAWFPSNTTSSWESNTSGFVYGKYDEVISSDNYDNLINLKNEKIYDDGRVFKGFYYDKEFTNPIDFSLGLKPEDPVQSAKTIDVNVYAKYVRDFTVTFKDWDGNILSNQTVLYGESAVLPEPPVRTGYRFIGWDNSTTNIQEDTVLTAQYEINSHRLTLDGNGGSLSGKTNITMDVTAGESLDQDLTDGKNNAIRKYYTFTGWYTAPTEGSKYPESGNVMPDTDLTVYAQWERSSSEVTFKEWNGTVIDRQEILLGADATPPEAPERAGYTFIGWDKPTANIQDHKEVTAQYSINGYLLTLDGNGGTLEGSPKKEVVISFDQSFDQILEDGKDLVERPGYQFDGWYTSASGGSIYSYRGNQMPSINVTVYAHWFPNTYKVTFDPDHVRWTEGVLKKEHTFDTELGTLPAPEIYGWKFNGWWTGKNGTGTKLTSHSMVESKDVVYYGNWYPISYEVRFISKAQQPEEESVQTFTVNQTYDQAFGTLPAPEEKGYTFTGWYDGENKKINPQTIFQPQSGAEGYTYHAGWESNSYQIQFVYYDADGKQVVIEINQDYPSRLGTLPSPEKPGYTFGGWFKDNGEQVTAGSWVEAGDTEYKAKWKANQYTIHFERNLPESETMEDPEDKTVTYALPIGVLPNLNETGYVFLGWFTEPEGGTRIKETTLAALGDQTYYGHWTIGIIDNGNGTYRKPGADGTWNTTDDELWWKGLDGISLTSDDKRILTFANGTGSYADNGNGTHYRPGTGGSWASGIELWWNGPDGIPGTYDDVRIYNGGNGSNGTPIYYIDSGNGIYIRPGAGGNWGSETQYWWYGPDGTPGTSDDRQIHILPGGGYYIDNRDGTYIRPGTGGSWTSGTEHWWYGPDGKPGTDDDKQIHVLPGGGYYIDNGDGTYIKPGTGGSWTSGTGHWWYGSDGKPGTDDDRQIHVLPGGGYYIDNGNGTYIRPGTGGSWTSGTEHWWYGPDGKPGTDNDRQIHVLPGGGYYIDNGDVTHIRPGNGGSWDHDTETWLNGPDGEPGTSDDYKKVDNGNTDPEPTDPEPTKPEPTDPEPTKPEPTDPEPTDTEPTDTEPTKPEPTKPDPVKPDPVKPNESKAKDNEAVTVPEIPSIDSTSKPSVRNDGGTFNVNPENPKDVTYIKPDGTPASNEWIGDGTNLYHVNEESKLNYNWYKEKDNEWFMLNNDPEEQFGAALRGWYNEPMDKKLYFFDPNTTEMLTGWRRIDNKMYYFTEKNQRQTYMGDNKIGWLFDLEILNTPLSLLDRPYGSMYRNEYTPDGFWVDENGVCKDKK
ncbi:InlB B-repeat-containing protein [Lacrimispora xylanolytica]|uniref:InlB B-repeat-containing protein n=1 Tax=Lacrimispora xylanolytica TaxID=29375 RepID=A0ABY7AAU3_9FIRM|nr:InlB B-repeat-containing protein [Lacrimispora xylanolytica]WAJ23554.1 InlB B-repeat-containing protein [Lacrimispora xylanolytica]